MKFFLLMRLLWHIRPANVSKNEISYILNGEVAINENTTKTFDSWLSFSKRNMRWPNNLSCINDYGYGRIEKVFIVFLEKEFSNNYTEFEDKIIDFMDEKILQNNVKFKEKNKDEYDNLVEILKQQKNLYKGYLAYLNNQGLSEEDVWNNFIHQLIQNSITRKSSFEYKINEFNNKKTTQPISNLSLIEKPEKKEVVPFELFKSKKKLRSFTNTGNDSVFHWNKTFNNNGYKIDVDYTDSTIQFGGIYILFGEPLDLSNFHTISFDVQSLSSNLDKF